MGQKNVAAVAQFDQATSLLCETVAQACISYHEALRVGGLPEDVRVALVVALQTWLLGLHVAHKSGSGGSE